LDACRVSSLTAPIGHIVKTVVSYIKATRRGGILHNCTICHRLGDTFSPGAPRASFLGNLSSQVLLSAQDQAGIVPATPVLYCWTHAGS